MLIYSDSKKYLHRLIQLYFKISEEFQNNKIVFLNKCSFVGNKQEIYFKVLNTFKHVDKKVSVKNVFDYVKWYSKLYICRNFNNSDALDLQYILNLLDIYRNTYSFYYVSEDLPEFCGVTLTIRDNDLKNVVNKLSGILKNNCDCKNLVIFNKSNYNENSKEIQKYISFLISEEFKILWINLKPFIADYRVCKKIMDSDVVNIP